MSIKIIKKKDDNFRLLLIFLILANYKGLKTILGGLLACNYTTELNEINSSEVPWKGIQFKDVKENFENFKKENPNIKDTTVYRTFKINPLKLWCWHDYLTHEGINCCTNQKFN